MQKGRFKCEVLTMPRIQVKFASMKVEECILMLLVEHNGGRTAEQLADEINRRKLHIRKDGQPVSVKQIWYAVKTHPETFTFDLGRIYLMI